MFIIYNKDGSIKKKNFAEFIQKGNNNANFIFVGIDGLDLTDYSCYATFELPTEELGGPVAGVPIVEFSEELPYSGYNIPVTAEMTQYEGQVKLSLHIENSQGAEMYTYPVILVINDATSAPDQTKINLSQYQALLNLVNSKAVPTSNLFFTIADDITAIPEEEWELYSAGKIFYDKSEKKFYEKDSNGAANVINLEDKTFNLNIELFDENGEYELTSNEEEIFLKCDIIYLRNPRTQYYAYLIKASSSTIRRPVLQHIERFYQVIEDDYYYKITYNNGTLTLELLSNLNYVEIPYQNSGVLTEVELETVKRANSCLKVNYGSDYYAIYVQHDYDPNDDEITFEYLTREDDTGGIWLFSKYLIKIDRSTGDWRRVAEAEDVAFCTTTYVNSLITGSVRFKGTAADLTALNAIQNPNQGDMYWVTSESSYYIWNGSTWSQTGGTVDLSNYVDKTSPQTITGSKTFTYLTVNNDLGIFGSITFLGTNSGIQGHLRPLQTDQQDLGTNSKKWKDLYLSGNLSDGNKSVSVSEIYDKVHETSGSPIISISNGVSGIISSGTFTQAQKDILNSNDSVIIDVSTETQMHFYFRKQRTYGTVQLFFCVVSDYANKLQVYRLYTQTNDLAWSIIETTLPQSATQTSINIESGDSGTLTDEQASILLNAGAEAKIAYGGANAKIYLSLERTDVYSSSTVATFSYTNIFYSAQYGKYRCEKTTIAADLTTNKAWSKTVTSFNIG